MEAFIIYTVGISLSVFALYFLGVSLAPYAPDKVKNDHFECGLPPSSPLPKRANFNFFIYAIMFIVADMTGLFFTLFVYADNNHTRIVASIFATVMAIVIFFAARELHGEENA
jgi:NADH-quinone oxidoreductase subunit A